MEENVETEEVKDTFLKDVLTMILYFLVVVFLSFLVVHFIGQRTQVSGKSMEPTLYHGDNLIVDKITYQFNAPTRYDIIVFPYEGDKEIYYIKRIIGLPGEKIQLVSNEIYINDKLLDEDYGKEPMFLNTEGIAKEAIILGDDEYFVLGDNRNHSSDSRDPDVGIIKKDSIIGRAWLRVWPFKRVGILKHQ